MELVGSGVWEGGVRETLVLQGLYSSTKKLYQNHLLHLEMAIKGPLKKQINKKIKINS